MPELLVPELLVPELLVPELLVLGLLVPELVKRRTALGTAHGMARKITAGMALLIVHQEKGHLKWRRTELGMAR